MQVKQSLPENVFMPLIFFVSYASWQSPNLCELSVDFFSEKYSVLLDMILPRENKSFTSSPAFPEYLIYYEYTQARFNGKFATESKIIIYFGPALNM